MTKHRLRPASRADLPRISQIRFSAQENQLANPEALTEAEVLWYLDEAVFLVSEDEAGVQGFACANQLSGFIWALFVADELHGRGHGTALHDAAVEKLRQAGNRQAFLFTQQGAKAEKFYQSRGWQPVGINKNGERAYRLGL